MELGTFTKHDDGRFTGTAKTLLGSFDLEYKPVEKVGNGPNYRVYVLDTDIEVGAAWTEFGEYSKKQYLDTKIDSPELPAPIWCALVAEEDGTFVLKWSRPEPKKKRGGNNGSAENASTAFA